MEGERFEGGSGKIKTEACGGIGGGHGESRVRVSLKCPVGDPNLHVFLGNFHLPKGASTEFFGEEKFSRMDIRDGEVGEGDVTNRPGGVGLGGDGLETVTEKGEFVAVGVSVFIVEVSGEVPPFGFKFGVRAVIPRKRPGPRLEGSRPGVGRVEPSGGEAKEENRKKLFHSERRASAGERWAARQAGGREAKRQAAIMPKTMPMREG